MIKLSKNENLLDSLLTRIRQYRRDTGLSVRAFTEMTGVPIGTLRDLDDPSWSPTVTTLRAILRAMDGPPGRLVVVAPRIEQLSIAVLPFRSETGRCLERVLKPEALHALGQTGLAAVVARLGPGKVSAAQAVEISKALVPGSAVHLVDAYPADPRRYRFLHWDASTGYCGGADFTGSDLADVGEAAYRTELVEAYSAARASGRCRLSFVHRRGPDGVRIFYRLLIPFIADGGGAEILSVTLPQEAQAARYLLANRMRV